MSGQPSWRIPVTGKDWVMSQEKRLMAQERRPKFDVLEELGPGTDAHAVRVVDWSSEDATYVGVFFGDPEMQLNSPDDSRHWIGETFGVSEGGGFQRLTEVSPTSVTGESQIWTRRFYRAADGLWMFGAWTQAAQQPVGSLLAVYGTEVMIVRDYPAYLIADGTAYDTDRYPRLLAWLTELNAAGVHGNPAVLPNWTDRFIFGAGVVPVGSASGSKTALLTVNNVPPHHHEVSVRENAPGFGTAAPAAASGGAIVTDDTTTTGGGDPFSIMPPYRAAYILIRAE